jgi:methanethiol S-methyltransferase
MLQAIAWSGGGAFVASLAFFLYTFLVTLARPAEPAIGTAGAALANVSLFVLFAAHHSLFARPRVKRWVARHVPPAIERSLFVWVASLLLIGVCGAWQPLPGVLYGHRALQAVPHLVAVLAGFVLTALGARRLDPLELAGIAQLRGRPRPAGRAVLVTTFPYTLVRHPIYLGWVLVVFGVPTMTSGRLLMAILSTAYLVVAVPWEERLLVSEFGPAYEGYRRRVKWRIVPGVY